MYETVITSEKGESHAYYMLLPKSFPLICSGSRSGLSWITLPVLCFVLLGFFEHQSFTGKMGEDKPAHSARCERSWVEELVCTHTSICEMGDVETLHQQ